MATLVRHTRAQDAYVAAYDAVRAGGAAGPAWLQAIRERALSVFTARGFPTTKDEEWRFTNVAPVAERVFGRADARAAGGLTPAVVDAAAIGAAGAARAVCVDGRYVAALSEGAALPHGVEVRSLREVLASEPDRLEPWLARVAAFDGHAFAALNTALFEDGVFVFVPPHCVLEAPIHLVCVTTANPEPVAAHPRLLVVAGEDSQCRIVEQHVAVGDGLYFANPLSEVVLEDHAVVDHYRVQREAAGAFHIGGLSARLGRAASFTSHAVSLGAALARHDISAELDGEGGECTLNGLYVADGDRLVDHHTTIVHARPHCDSHEVYKGILAGRAHGVFNGKIVVRPAAQKTDAKQTNRALLLSDEAQITTKPQLEIFADDVKCTHGAAVGQLDEDAIFYVRSRGLDLREARRLLVQAFAGDILGRMRVEPLRQALETAMLALLPEP
jgi:Fe-S cluster assembly protein SufD